MSASSRGKLLTQAEVAAVLRRDISAVARLRRSGQLAYLPGSPVLIPETELEDYLQRKMIKRQAVAKDSLAQSARESERKLQSRGEAIAAKMRKEMAPETLAMLLLATATPGGISTMPRRKRDKSS